MSSSRSARFLHLQLGQEVIYLLLAIALGSALVMATLLLAPKEESEDRPDEPPPIIALTEADGYYFAVGSAELPRDFEQRLIDEIVPLVVSYRRSYHADVLEVVGHTDEIPVRQGADSNLDGALLSFLGGAGGVRLTAADNTGLGMARAAAVARVLIADPRIAGMRVLPLSGGQAIQPDDSLADPGDPHDDESRRRIEIRLRRTR